ncbi:MAG: hypothetical protein R2862_10320 [Thermoanaerobaculia bacterium]
MLEAGGLALLLLPACFLHFFLVYPQPIGLRPRGDEADYARLRRRWLALLAALYALPLVVLGVTSWIAKRARTRLRLITGAPEASWWCLGIYMLLGLLALGWSARRLTDRRQRRGLALILFGSLCGLGPFLTLAVLRPHWLREPHAFYVLAPLALVPATFAFAIVRSASSTSG